jgi:NAD(P)-dependent dehydrogenase (short-subunit alcohol dehydrogenase family)
VIGLVRDVPSVKKKVSAELAGRSNIHIVHGDLSDYDSLKSAAKEAAAITGGSLDYLIANAAMQSLVDGFNSIGDTCVPFCHRTAAGDLSN